MIDWFKKQAWWIGLVLAVLIALFPDTFSTIGTTVKSFTANYWLQILLSMNTVLLVIIYRVLRE